jgi:hypothetical protein
LAIDSISRSGVDRLQTGEQSERDERQYQRAVNQAVDRRTLTHGSSEQIAHERAQTQQK